jgi:hypothetical protein
LSPSLAGIVMKKLDLRKELQYLYRPSARDAELVNIPRFNFLMIDGKGNPNNSKEFQDAIQALYSLSYTLKFQFKFNRHIDYPVMPLEGLWWMGDGTAIEPKRYEDWHWTVMILQPSIVTKSLVAKCVNDLKVKKDLASLESIRLEPFVEGRAVQIMHIGPYNAEGPTLHKLNDFAVARGLTFCGKHHEIYMSDPRRVKPEKMKTILRLPVKRK